MEINETYNHRFRFSQDEVNRFAELTGDTNPAHTDAAYAATTLFKRPILHGMLGAALFSKVFGTLFPGEGTIYLKQSLNFLRPMYPDKEYDAVFTVKDVLRDKNRAIVETVIRDLDGKLCTSGEATVLNTTKIQ